MAASSEAAPRPPANASSEAALPQARPPARAAARRGPPLPFWLLVPSLLLIFSVVLYPAIVGFNYSVSSGTLLKPGEFVGLANYLSVLGSTEFLHALRFSLLFAVANVAGCYVLGLLLALLMNADIPMRGVFRVIILVPWIVPSVVSVVSWRWMLANETALVNQILGLVGIDPVLFLSDGFWAGVSVTIIKIWRSLPFMMLSLLAALQGIDRSLYEAAALDGASRWQAFWEVTLPQLKNVSIVLCLLMTIWTVNDFDTPYLLTEGGPDAATENLVLLAYRYTFGRMELGPGAAISFITLALLMVFIVAMLKRRGQES